MIDRIAVELRVSDSKPMARVTQLGLLLGLLAATPGYAHEGAPAKLSRLVLDGSESEVEALYERVEAYRNLRQNADALMMLELIEALDPNEARVWFERGCLARDRSDHASAIAAFTRFLDAGAPTYAAHWLRGRAHLARGEASPALADFRAAVAIAPGIDAHVDLSRLLVRRGAIEEARASLQRGLDATGSVVLRQHLARLQIDHRLEDAVATIDPLVATSRVKTRWLLLRAEAHEAAGRSAEANVDRSAALDEARRLVDKRPSPAALTDRAAAHASLGATAAAIADLRAALSRAPRYPRARALLLRLQEAS